MKDRIKELRQVKWREIHPLQPDNAKVIMNFAHIEKSIKKHGFSMPFFGWENEGEIYCVDGHSRLEVLNNMDNVPETLPVLLIDAKNRQEAVEILIEVFNQKSNPFDLEVLEEWINIEQVNVNVESINVKVEEIEIDNPEVLESQEEKQKKLSDRFIIPPFSVLDTKQGDWQQRKNYWLSLGIRSEEGINAKAYTGNDDILQDGTKFYNGDSKGTSIFDPVLCELAYKWFNIPNGKIIDPFAGGSVRGIVAAKLGYEYLGNDLRSEQIEANRLNAKEVLQDSELYPTWTCGDSLNIDTIAKDYKADLVFSCPPYADLEVYSDKKEDLSNMDYDNFIKIYREIIRKSCEQLNDDRFAVFVVGDVRDKKGFYRNFVSDTIMAFWNCGVILYNEMILVNMLGNLPMRAGKYFNTARKIGKQHQNVLVFYKGNPKNIKQNYPELDLSYINTTDI